MLTKTVDDIDRDLNKLRDIIADSLRDSEAWKVAWERIDELLEVRNTFTKVE